MAHSGADCHRGAAGFGCSRRPGREERPRNLAQYRRSLNTGSMSIRKRALLSRPPHYMLPCRQRYPVLRINTVGQSGSHARWCMPDHAQLSTSEQVDPLIATGHMPPYILRLERRMGRPDDQNARRGPEPRKVLSNIHSRVIGCIRARYRMLRLTTNVDPCLSWQEQRCERPKRLVTDLEYCLFWSPMTSSLEAASHQEPKLVVSPKVFRSKLLGTIHLASSHVQ